ncbi:hypothetical protein KO516_14965 [Citreicella sp. C3M06]|uniref:hypothetical protein n=1 Tax=Citreicella sp. C3M06 TaxID=2841564 RepID=UPI001C0914AF|nr:hypothetical protein [Citreicella sp. C3M06]MBU2962087.1 hypothetical protein [Citreicella sp. C3M06]
MTEIAHNLLTEPLIETDVGWLTLPGVLAAMARGEVTCFRALRPHQRPAWHMFLVQLGVLALDKAGQTNLPGDESTWRGALRGLTIAFPDDAPWCLLAPDGQPAFLQPPAAKDGKWTEVETPDNLDMLITSRNHDLKMAVARNAGPQDWIYALVSVQTMEGYSGPTWNGVARMNGGSSSRAMVTLAPALPDGKSVHPSLWWQRDTRRLLADRSPSNGLSLVWLMEWMDAVQLRIGEDLDPLFIEICRRIRLFEKDGALMARKAGSKKSRIANVNGMTDDPWAPTSIRNAKSLTLGDSGDFTYAKLREVLMSGEWAAAPMAKPAPDEVPRDMLLVAEAFARGNSKTGGFRSRVIPISKSVVKRMLGATATDQSAALIEDIKRVDIALRNALALMAANGLRENIKTDHYARTNPARIHLDQQADRMFFPVLWDMLAAETQDVRLQIRARFMLNLSDHARAIYREALPAIPCKAVMRPRAEARATDRLEAGLKDALGKSDLADHLPKHQDPNLQKREPSDA